MKNQSIISLKNTIRHMVPAVFTAIIATGLGFIALFTSPVPMIKDFGKMLTIGIAISFIVGLFILIPILFTRDHFFANEIKKGNKKNKTEKSDVIFEKITKKVVSLKWLVIILAIVTAGIGIWGDMNAGVETDVETFMPQNNQELKDIHKLRDLLGTTDQVSIMYSSNDVLGDQTLKWTDEMTESLKKEFPDVVVDTKSVTSVLKQTNNQNLPENPREIITSMPEDQSKLFINEGKTKGVITVGIKHLEASELKSFINKLETYVTKNQEDAVSTTITGKSVVDVEMVSSLTTGRHK
ncbi:MAG TPA: hypothetical protein VJ546_04745, partial [Bacillales bacterium]|nr:hypothetical protein [Bacillales bacterium]